MTKLMIPETGREVDVTSVSDLHQCIAASIHMMNIVSTQISEASRLIYNIYAGQCNNNNEEDNHDRPNDR